MKKLFLSFLISGILLNISNAQENYSKLKELFDNGDFKKAEQKASNYTNGDTYKDPEPYIYRSMCFYEFYKDSALFIKTNWYGEVHPLKQAVVDAVAFRKKDKLNKYYPKYSAYINELKNELISRGEVYLSEGNYKKANKYYKYMVKIDPSDPTSLLMKAICEFNTNNETKARISLDKAMDKIAAIKDLSTLRNEEQLLLKKGLIELASYLIKSQKTEDAKLAIDFGYIHFSSDQEYNKKYDEVMSI